MRTIALIVVGLAALTASLAWALALLHSPSPPPPVAIYSQGPTIERLERLSQLVTIRVHVADVLVGEGEGCRGAWLIKGDALVGVNLGQARITEKDEATKQARIVLPAPEVLQPRVNHERTRTWQVSRMAWLPWNADQDRLRDAVMLQAQQLVAHAAASSDNLQQAKTAAEAIITAFYREVGWQVTVSWANPNSDGQKMPSSSK